MVNVEMMISAHRTKAVSGTKRKENSGTHTHFHIKQNTSTQGLLPFTRRSGAGRVEVNASERPTLGLLWGHIEAFIHAQHIFIPQARIYK